MERPNARFMHKGALAASVVLVALLATAALAVAAGNQKAEAVDPMKEKIAKIVRTAPVTQEQREAAAKQMKALKDRPKSGASSRYSAAFDLAAVQTTTGPGGIPDYFGTTPNWAFSPLLRKFVDGLPGVGSANANNLGQYISVAKPDTTTYPGSDYYEISVREYSEKMHSDLPPTRLRGYVQTNQGTDANGNNTLNPDPIHYLGASIVAQKGRPVRIKFTNELPTGTAGDLFVPVDETIMGAGEGPDGGKYTQNRADLHLHGGFTPWISDGTPHQWITPAGENTTYTIGASTKNVPDMPDPGPGSSTYYYTNDQTARLMFYHDHSYGITRLNVYVGEAAAYILQDEVEKKLVADNVLPAEEIPLIIQDRTFVDASTISTTDPTWNWGTTPGTPHTGDLWVPHVYVPAQNPALPDGINPTGRWHYGPWFWPPVTDIAHPPIVNPWYDPINAPWENYLMPSTPQPSVGMEHYNDTPLVNGTAYPVLKVDPKSYRLRILNAANDRFFNLQMYEAHASAVADKRVTRRNGRTRYDVAVSSALSAYPKWTGVTDVVIASGEDRAQPDALTAAGLAGALDAPLLLVQSTSLNPQVRTALNQMPAGVNVHIVGGTVSVSPNVMSQMNALSNVGTVNRITGKNRYGTAAAVARRMNVELGAAMPGTVLFVNGNLPAAMFDALTASAVSAKMHFPVLLVTDTSVPPETSAVLRDIDLTDRYIVGGTVPVSSSVQTALGVPSSKRIFGSNRYATATAVAKRAKLEGWLSSALTGFAAKIPDAATGGVYMGKNNGPVLFVNPLSVPQPTVNSLKANRTDINAGVVFGGELAVNEGTRLNLQALIQTPVSALLLGEVKMVPAETTSGFPELWPQDGRPGGAPDPATAGPQWIQVATEGGFLPKPAIIPNQPITWNMDPTMFNVGNVQDHSLLLGNAERADVVVDFSKYAGKTLILYNDAPTAFPALDPRTDYYTGNEDFTETGGTKPTKPGYGPNTRTIMQIKVAAKTPAPEFDLDKLNAAFASTDTTKGVFAASQDPILIPDARYDSTYATAFPADQYVRIYDTETNFQTLDATITPGAPYTSRTVTMSMEPKAIQDEQGEVFDLDYGRMSGKLGLEMPRTNAGNANFILYSFIDPSTENLTDSMTPLSPVGEDGTQIWKITHNGVDTHPIHFHLFNVQLINRVGWDGFIRTPDDNELGWKETVRISPLEDTIVALKPVSPKLPFGIPDSERPLNPARPIGDTMGFSGLDPLTGQRVLTPVTNEMTNFGWEYVWHCHILSHEEMDMMRPMSLDVTTTVPPAPVLAASGAPGSQVALSWTDATPASSPMTAGNTGNEIGFRIERAVDGGAFSLLHTALANSTGYADNTTQVGHTYDYRVTAWSTAGEIVSNVAATP